MAAAEEGYPRYDYPLQMIELKHCDISLDFQP